MAKCRYCRKKGWFLSVDRHGLCKSCQPVVGMEVSERVRLIKSSVEVAEKSKKFETKISRLEFILEQAKELSRLEARGIHMASVSAGQINQMVRSDIDNTVQEHVETLIQKALDRSETAATPAGKLNPINKAITQVRDLKREYPDMYILNDKESALLACSNAIQVHAHIDAARKAEFKNQHKKALDQYQEALYFLLNDEVPDKHQKEVIVDVKQKIAALEKAIS